MSFDQKPEQTTDQLTFSVGERSFNAESAATKIENADNHIQTIEAENQGYKDRLASLEAQVAQSTKIDDALAKLQQPSQESQATEVTPSVSEEQIGAIATKQMEEYLAAKQVTDNNNAAKALSESTFRETGERLTAIYGDNTDKAMEAKAKELGISAAAIFDMARNPTTASLLLESMKVIPSTNQASPSGSFNTSSLSHNAPDKLLKAKGSKLTSSTILAALNEAGGRY